jgi:acyl-CoA thioester hydrolase
MSGRFTLPVAIVETDIDQLGHVNNSVYLRWVQEAATAHWQVRALPEWQEKFLWVVLRHEIDYKKSAKMGDGLVACTWVGTAHGARFVRYVDIMRSEVILVTAKTTWVMVEAQTLRPLRVTPEIIAAFSV